MAIVTEAMRRGSGSERCDVAVVGAGLPGLVAASVLARAGARVVLVDAARRPGGRLQTISHQGFAIDASPPLWDADGLREALAAAGVAAPTLAPVVARRDVYAAVVEGGGVRGGAHPLLVPGTVPSPVELDAVGSLLGVKPRTWAALGEACAELVATGEGAPGDPSSTTSSLASWASTRSLEAPVSAALLRCAEIHGALDPARADVRRVAHLFRRAASGDATHVVPAEHAVAGTRAIVQELVDAAVAAGVETRLGTRALAVVVERGRVGGLVLQREELPFLSTLGAGRVVLALSPAEASSLLPADAGAPAVPRPAGSVLGFAFGLRSAPWADDAPPPLRLVGPALSRGSLPSPGSPASPILLSAPQAHAPGVAPPGQGLLLAHATVPGDRLDPGEASRLGLLLRSVVIDLHPDVEIAWERSWFRSGEALDPFAEPPWPESLPAVKGLRFAGWGVRLARCVTSGPSAAAASAVDAARATWSGEERGADDAVSLGRPPLTG
ncbi:MAG: FAD-dependent oxidoreductase [Alphaproteobacteria bacterium]